MFLSSGEINKKQVEKLLGDLGISEMLIQIVEGCLMYDEANRLSWKDLFNHPIF